MLRFPASCIELTTSDVAECERRFAAKKASQALQPTKSQTTLHHASNRLPKLDIIVADDSRGRKRADSCMSQATCRNQPDQAASSTNYTERMGHGSGNDRAMPSKDNSLSPMKPSPGTTLTRKPVTLSSTPSSPVKVDTYPQIRSPPRVTPKSSEFVIYEASAEEQSLIEAQHLGSIAQAQHIVGSIRPFGDSYRPTFTAKRPALVPAPKSSFQEPDLAQQIVFRKTVLKAASDCLPNRSISTVFTTDQTSGSAPPSNATPNQPITTERANPTRSSIRFQRSSSVAAVAHRTTHPSIHASPLMASDIPRFVHNRQCLLFGATAVLIIAMSYFLAARALASISSNMSELCGTEVALHMQPFPPGNPLVRASRSLKIMDGREEIRHKDIGRPDHIPVLDQRQTYSLSRRLSHV
ncbi:hypothetical protein TI39_contig4247g00007 [Zymoseptoria brevis]|uniref:Uncharacterized protein n=1 Tax=Zymoseptoria brevis TaxID=1047168 RepID=A0A0F4G929_9PEZI|nr:hypothetical protein TI39_contig4247g00007 [Zymoseptoria brevis]